MKNDVLTATLVGVLAISAIASVVLCYRYVKDSRELRSLQTQMVMIQQREVAIQSLAREAFAYSQKNPAITPLLESLGIQAAPANQTTNNH